MLHNFPVTLSKKILIAENTVELTFSVSDPSFSFKAGQYVSIEIPSLSGFSVPDRCHDFSVASSPSNPKEISIAFRISQSIFKTALLVLPLGGVVNIDGPKGVLTLPEPERPGLESADSCLGHENICDPAVMYPHPVPLIFVAGGIGITPLLSMIRFATETLSSQKIILLYCNARKETTAYHEELLALEKQNVNFTLHGAFGVPDDKLFVPYVQKAPDALWYIVGAPAMVKAVQQILAKSGIIDTQIRIEEFSGYGQ